jgi:nucleolar protein 56
MQDLSKFGKMIKLVSFAPFQYVLIAVPCKAMALTESRGAAQALENANEVSEGIASSIYVPFLKSTSEARQEKKVVLGVADKNLAGSIKAAFPRSNVRLVTQARWFKTCSVASACMRQNF